MHEVHDKYSKVQKYISSTPFYSVAPYSSNNKIRNVNITSDIMKVDTGASKTYLKAEHANF